MKLTKRQTVVIGILSLILSFLEVAGWQLSMDYGSSVHTSALFQKIGVLNAWQCVLFGVLSFVVFFLVFAFLFRWLEKHSLVENEEKMKQEESHVKARREILSPRKVFWISFAVIAGVWMALLWAIYPGYYNYDVGSQLSQVLYADVPYNAHHPLLHTLFMGSIIKLGYTIYPTDTSLGVFFYNAVQMILIAFALSYSLRFIYKKTHNIFVTAFSLVFYTFSPTIIMFAMSTTKDALSLVLLFVGILRLWESFDKAEAGEETGWVSWILTAIFLALSCLTRKNIVYAVAVFAVFSVIFIKYSRKKQIVMYLCVLAMYLTVDKGLLTALHAIPDSPNEALCVPYQQMARLYTMEGEEAFTEEEYQLFTGAIASPGNLYCYDPVMADPIKANFNPGLVNVLSNRKEYLFFWMKKGLEYPDIYIDSLMYNTYQAWYPGTHCMDARGSRYFEVGVRQYENPEVRWQGLYDFYYDISQGEYAKIPVVRLLFSTGAMFWLAIVTLFYGIYRGNKNVIACMALAILVCGSNMVGPISLVRYYLVLFYLMPVCVAALLQKNRK